MQYVYVYATHEGKRRAVEAAEKAQKISGFAVTIRAQNDKGRYISTVMHCGDSALVSILHQR